MEENETVVIEVSKINIQYYHCHNSLLSLFSGSKTIAVKVPTKDELVFLMLYRHKESALRLSVQIGVSRLNPKDKNYIKKIGRQLSKERLSLQEFDLEKIEYDKKNTILTLKNKECSIKFKLEQNSKKVFFVNYNDDVLK